ncbi:HNH endonuclease [Nocardioides sp. YIM 152588]|uniref:HNH endonuclease n=1 Tax=Nocardioides sp. YIM 152588 TaxID=3158259 RepID=UPI0032E39AD1
MAHHAPVVLLNASCEPHDLVSFPHAVRMLFRGVAVVHEADADRTIGPHPWPKVVRLVRYVVATWMHRPAAFGREAVLRRDRRRCAYCGARADTVDHVVPRSRGGPWSWLNAVAACGSCNSRKADRTPVEAGMRLRFDPWEPTRAQVTGWRAR